MRACTTRTHSQAPVVATLSDPGQHGRRSEERPLALLKSSLLCTRHHKVTRASRPPLADRLLCQIHLNATAQSRSQGGRLQCARRCGWRRKTHRSVFPGQPPVEGSVSQVGGWFISHLLPEAKACPSLANFYSSVQLLPPVFFSLFFLAEQEDTWTAIGPGKVDSKKNKKQTKKPLHIFWNLQKKKKKPPTRAVIDSS